MSAAADFHHVYVQAEEPGRPTLLLLHGTGADEHDLLGLGRALAPGAALLSPRGKVDEHGANRWFRRLREGVYDVDDVIARSSELTGFIGAATAEYGLDPRGVVAVGFSNGANIAAATLLLHPGALAGAALFASAAPLQDREPDRVDLSGTPVFLGAGRTDPITTVEEARLLARQLRERGADVRMHEHPGGHALPAPVLADARDWLAASGLSGAPADGGADGPSSAESGG
ncbi:alpha/beta hydrolase [Streptomonospora litoralis]|uniref:Hydrolase MhqD n=1 Tax=Streptomonospora litoralis TaxID=2498135 RepID=A0A4P6QAC1_9ACTN|nr:alpha/beta hydrolase [Streptomonospora litoralis]QBI56364.1 Putative hydrolase MhqD [Streptomonospora litoralis]